jgi:hypothetical protein
MLLVNQIWWYKRTSKLQEQLRKEREDHTKVQEIVPVINVMLPDASRKFSEDSSIGPSENVCDAS